MAWNSILISTLIFAVVVGLHIACCRLFGARSSIRSMFMLFALYIAAVAYVWFAYFISDLMGWITLLAMSCFWCLSYMEFFSMMCRGFSLNLMVQLQQKPGLSMETLIREYGGVGVEGLLQKRLNDLEKLNFIRRENGVLHLSAGAATQIASLTAFYKKILRLGKGG